MKTTSIALLATSASSTTILVTNSALLQGPKGGWNTTVWSVDMGSGSFEMVADTYKSRPALSGAVVCDDVYYTVWADPPNYGMRMLDLKSGKSTDLATSSLFHVLACDPKNSSQILGTASDFTSSHGVEEAYTARTSRVGAGAAPPFHLKSYDPATQTEAVVGTFPAADVIWAGYDGIFSFSKDGSEVWAGWPKDSCPGCANAKKGGHVHVMDTATGVIKDSAAISFGGPFAKKGSPYYVLPDAKRAVLVMSGDPSLDLEWSDLDVSSKSAKATVTKTDANSLWASSSPAQMCGDNLVSLHVSGAPGAQGATEVNEVSPKDGSIVNTFDLTQLPILRQPRTDVAAVACLKPSSAAE